MGEREGRKKGRKKGRNEGRKEQLLLASSSLHRKYLSVFSFQ